jgi:two-component system, LuxR family, response regulator DctR
MNEPRVHIVDDDAAIRDALCWLLRSRGVAARAWESGETFLASSPSAAIGCIVLDVRMEGISGIEVHDQLIALGSRTPVIFLTGHGDVALAVAALKKGAFDFVEKPFNDNELVDRILDAMRLDEALRLKTALQASVEARLAKLSPREREVMDRIVAGDFNKTIADALQIAVRTVEVHRAHIFEKMEVRSAVELATILSRLR